MYLILKTLHHLCGSKQGKAAVLIYSYILISTGEGAENSISSSCPQSIPETGKT